MAQRLRRRSRHRYLGILPMLAAIAGCSITDSFSPRAVQYNQEAANAKISAILANIVRASNFMPLQFTEYTQVVGQLYAGGNLAGTLPVFPGPGSVPRIYELSPTVSANAQTNVTVQNLNSQEFYNGLQSQVSQPMLANFLAIGFDPDVVFMLLVSSLRSRRDGKIVELRNDPDTAAQFKAFYDAGKMLRLSGFTFETSAGAEKFIGPQLTEAEAKTLMSSYIAALGVAAASGNASALPDLSKNRAGRFQFSKTSATFRICFDESKLRRFARGANPDLLVSSRSDGAYVVHLQLAGAAADRRFDLVVRPSRLCGAGPRNSVRDADDTNWELELRPAEAIYKYLGRLLRAQSRDPERYDSDYLLWTEAPKPPFHLFRVHEGHAGRNAVSVQVDARHAVSITVGDERDRTPEVLALLADLWALQSSAKTYPASTTISVNSP
jgi:hypothetical protein